MNTVKQVGGDANTAQHVASELHTWRRQMPCPRAHAEIVTESSEHTDIKETCENEMGIKYPIHWTDTPCLIQVSEIEKGDRSMEGHVKDMDSDSEESDIEYRERQGDSDGTPSEHASECDITELDTLICNANSEEKGGEQETKDEWR